MAVERFPAFHKVIYERLVTFSADHQFPAVKRFISSNLLPNGGIIYENYCLCQVPSSLD